MGSYQAKRYWQFNIGWSFLFGVLSISPGTSAWGDTSADTADLEQGTKAKLVSSAPPKYPRSALNRGLEGWVILNFVVMPDGTIADPIVEDSSGNNQFEKAALEVANEWQYSPATWNGNPVEQCHTNVRVTFAIEGDSARGVSAGFMRAYKKFRRRMEEDKIDEAEAVVNNVFERSGLNLYEMSFAWIMRSIVARKRENPDKQLRALRKAAVSEGKWMEPERYRAVLQKMFWLEIQTEQFSDALASYRQLQDDSKDLAEEIETVASQLLAKIEGPAVFGKKGIIQSRFEVETSPNWRYEPVRRKIGIQDIEGSVEKLEIRCDWNRATDTVFNGKTWDIPDSWGHCRIFVFGVEGASFTIVEFPDSEQISHVPDEAPPPEAI